MNMSTTSSKINFEIDHISSIHNYHIDIPNREIYLHSYISDSDSESGVDYRSATVFEKNIRYLNTLSMDPILVHMHIPGGEWQDCRRHCHRPLSWRLRACAGRRH